MKRKFVYKHSHNSICNKTLDIAKTKLPKKIRSYVLDVWEYLNGNGNYIRKIERSKKK